MNGVRFDRGKLFSFFFCTEYAVRHFERIVSAEYYNSNQEYRAGSIAAKANMVKQFDEKNSKKKK